MVLKDKSETLAKLEKEEKEFKESQPKPKRCQAMVTTAVFGYPEKEYQCRKEYGHTGGHHWTAWDAVKKRELRLYWETEEL